jgi:HPt (histidine-containing phosphotransfer) domain-containing protein
MTFEMTGTSERAIDRSVLGEWLANEDAAVDAMLVIFRDSAVDEEKRMWAALARYDLTGFAQAAHRLRGAALSMGARTLAQTVAAIELAAQSGDDSSCASGMAALEAQMGRMVAEVPAESATRAEGASEANGSTSRD